MVNRRAVSKVRRKETQGIRLNVFPFHCEVELDPYDMVQNATVLSFLEAESGSLKQGNEPSNSLHHAA